MCFFLSILNLIGSFLVILNQSFKNRKGTPRTDFLFLYSNVLHMSAALTDYVQRIRHWRSKQMIFYKIFKILIFETNVRQYFKQRNTNGGPLININKVNQAIVAIMQCTTHKIYFLSYFRITNANEMERTYCYAGL